MKQKKFYLVLFSIIALVLCEKVSMGQVVVVDSVEKSNLFNLKNPTTTNGNNTKELQISVDENLQILQLQIGAQTKSGIITFTIYDPNGKKRDNLSVKFTEQGKFCYVSKELPEQKALYLGGRTLTPDETVQGAFSASYNNPIQGIWKIIVTSENANGAYIIYQELKDND